MQTTIKNEPLFTLTQAAEAIFSPSNDVLADVVRFTNTKDSLNDFRDSIKARLDSEIQASKVPVAEAVKDLRKNMINAGIDKRRASEVLLDLGFRERAAAKSTSAKATKKDDLAAKLAPVIAKLIALADAELGNDEEAISALRRAYLTKAGKA